MASWFGDLAKDAIEDARRRAAARQEAANAMDLYKKQQAEADKSIAERKAQQDMEKRIINEKQIRQLRASFRRPGLMDVRKGGEVAAPAQSAGTMQPMEASR